MNAPTLLPAARGYTFLVGAMDALTGLALVAAPAASLARMGVSVPGTEAMEYVRFVGVFVAAVGASYLGIAATSALAVFRAGLAITTLFRLGAGVFTLVAVMRGAFDRAWLVVAATDLTCVVMQVWILFKGGGRDD